MRVERAIFTSDQDRDVRGYQLVARSSGIDDELAQKLIGAAPTHDSLDSQSPDACSLNYTHFNNWAVLSRTIYGGPEYSNRGSFRVITSFAIVPLDGLQGYASNPYLLTRMAFSLGMLSAPYPLSRNLPTLQMTEQTILSEFGRSRAQEKHSSLVQTLCDSLGDTRPVVISGASCPEQIIQQVYARISQELRLWVSYSTCLKPSINRPYRLQFCGPCDARRLSTLESRGFRCLQVQ